MDSQVAAFLKRLHQRAGRRCFTSGAFVVQVPPTAAFRALLDGLVTRGSRRVGARTHDDFSTAAKLARRRLCGSSCAAPVAQLRAGKQMEYPLAPMRPCGSTAVKRVLLFYQFWVGGAHYLYLKLESHPALSVRHAASAASRYLLKREKKSTLPTRREDAYKDRGGVVAAAALTLARDNAAQLWPGQAGDAARYDATVRVGREMFVPAAVAAQLAQSSVTANR